MTLNALDDISYPISVDDLEEVDAVDGRVDARLPWCSVVDVPVRERTLRLETTNVSNGGMFVCARVLPRVGGTVHVRMRLPPEGDVIYLECVVRHVVEPEVALDAPPGFGLELAVAEEHTRARWVAFIGYLARDSRTKILTREVLNGLKELEARLASGDSDSAETRSLTGEELVRLLEGSDPEARGTS